jgi:hypothetical protein
MPAFARRRHGYYHQRPFGPQNETTLEYLQIAQLESTKFSPLDTLLRNAAQVADVLKLGKR